MKTSMVRFWLVLTISLHTGHRRGAKCSRTQSWSNLRKMPCFFVHEVIRKTFFNNRYEIDLSLDWYSFPNDMGAVLGSLYVQSLIKR